ncbi:MAG: PDZ domain-containing protein [Firmicutes bacterium]|nr:PDZ domain-containing protein [Bacillota bacterium]
MLRKFSLVLVLMLALVWVQPAAAYDDYLDGVTTIEEILDYTLRNHVDKPELDVLVDGAIEGMLERLEDPHTEYMSPESLKDFSDSLNGDYVGIGIRMELHEGYPMVVEVFEYSPAEQAELKPGDLIVAVDGEDIKDIPLSFAAVKIQGPEDTKVSLTIMRNDKEFDVTLTRAAVTAPTVTHEVMSDNIGYIDINSFGQDTSNHFKAALKELQQQKVSGLILDLRDDPGGYVMAAVRIADNFLPVGKKVVSIVDKDKETQVYRSFGEASIADLPMVILVNGDTASAAEILAGALQDHGEAKVIGGQTYGKGTVQTVLTLSNGGALKLTMAKYQLPGGRFIDGIGLIPDKQVLSPGLQLFTAKNIIQPANQQKIIYTLSKNKAVVNGENIEMMAKPYLGNGQHYVPIRFTMEALGYTVNFDSQRNGIQLTRDNEGFFIPTNGSETSQPVEISEGVSYLSIQDLDVMGINYTVKDNVVTIIQD